MNDLYGRPISGKKFEYQIISEGRELLSGKGKTGVNGTGEIVFITPSPKNNNAILVSLDVLSGNEKLNMISKIPLVSEKINITFFPEGGKLVPGIPQMIIYEAKDQLGNPVSLKADIIDDQGKILSSTNTIQPGLGVFSLINNYDKNLVMSITSDIGKGQQTLLPPLSPGSMSIAVKKSDGKNLPLLLGRSPKSEPAKFLIVAVCNGDIIWASNFEIEQSGLINIPLDNFHSEIAVVAIFNETGAMVGQRLIYTGKNRVLNLTFSPNKNEYKKGEEGEIKLKIADPDGKPVKTELAVSLADLNTFPASSSSVDFLNYGLDKPCPFTEPLEKVNRIALDYFLATCNLKGFDLSQVLTIDPSKNLNITPKALRISGKVIDSKDLPVPNALVSLTSSTLQQFNDRSNEHGEFVIKIPVSVDKKNLSASATDGSGKGNFRVILNKSFKDELVNSLNNASVNEWQILNQLYQSNYFKENPDYLKARSTAKAKSNDKKIREPYWKKYISGSSNLLEILKSIRPYELIDGKIVFRGSNSLNAQDGALIVIDGQKIGTDAAQLSIINPQDIDDIQILLDPVEMSRYTALNSVGIIEITTKRGGNNDNKATDVPVQKMESSTKQFIPEAIGNGKYDLKTTLQWIPVLFTDENGEATITFKTGNIKSTFVLEIAGFTDNGQWVGGKTEIRVK